MDLKAIQEALRGRYRIERELGRGGMGVVYQAFQDNQQRRVALKLVSAAQVDDLDWAARLDQEARLAARISHPNVVRVYELERLGDGWSMIAFELVQGKSLRTLLDQEAPLAPNRVRDLGVGLASGLDAIHAAGILHRDLKPENVLLAQNESLTEFEPKITDLGIAKDTAGDAVRTKTGIMLGTPPYMAPEHILGQGNYTGAVDVYALGCMLFEMVTGRLPFDSPNVAHILASHVNSEPPRISDLRGGVPAELADVIYACLRKEPGERPTAAQLVDLLARPDVISAPPEAPQNAPAAAARTTEGLQRRSGRTAAVDRSSARNVLPGPKSGLSGTVPIKQSVVRDLSVAAAPAARPWRFRAVATLAGVVTACVAAAIVSSAPQPPRGRLSVPERTLARAAANLGSVREAVRKPLLERLARLADDPLFADLRALLKARAGRRLRLPESSGVEPIAKFFTDEAHAAAVRDHTVRMSETAAMLTDRYPGREPSMAEQRLITDGFVARVELERCWALLPDDADLIERSAGFNERWDSVAARLGRRMPKFRVHELREMRAQLFRVDYPPVEAALQGVFRELALADQQPLPEFEKFRSCWRGLGILGDVVEVDASASAEREPFYARVRPTAAALARDPYAAALMAAVEDSRGPNHSFFQISARFRDRMPKPPAGQVISPLWQNITDHAVLFPFPFSRL